MHSIVGQQISTKAHETIWARIQSGLGTITPERVIELSDEELQRFGISFRKVAYIKSAALKIAKGELDIQSLYGKTDVEVTERLSELAGIGIWSAEMLMLFSMQRRDIFSYGDLAIQRGLRMVYHHRQVSRELFEKYRRRYSPYGSVASLYLWAVAGGAIDGMKDYAIAAGILLLSALTDFFDGKVARRFDMITDWGKILDPIADKLTQGIVVISLIFRYRFMAIVLVIFIVQQLGQGILGLIYIKKSGKVEGAKMFGKVSTAFLDFMVLVLVIWIDIPKNVALAMMTVSVFLMTNSLLRYFDYYYKEIRK